MPSPAPAPPPRGLTIAEWSARFAAGTATPRDAVEACLATIDAHEADVRAWVLVDRDGARAAADRWGAEWAAGKVHGPLQGIPLGIKDLYDVAGWPTRAGSELTSAKPAARDAPLVAALRQAGAILMGKTVTTSWAWIDPPPTRNPWNLAHTPGGSSSGSAAAVAAGMCPGALGSQTGGSITRPASYCGLCGLKPSWALLNADGVVPVSFHLDHPGPLATSIADLRLLFEVLLAAASPTRREFVRARSAGRSLGPRAPRLGWVGDYFPGETEPATWNVLSAAIEHLGRAGAEVRPARLPASFARVHAAHRRIMAIEAAWYHRERFPRCRDAFGPHLAQLLDEGRAATAFEYAEALSTRLEFRRELAPLLAEFDALVTPATTGPAPPRLDTTGDPRFNSPWSFAGVPTVCLPAGLVDGMPVGLQLIAPWYGELGLLETAAWVEERGVRGW